MKTTYTLYRTDGTQEDGEVDWPKEPGYDRLKAVITPLLDGSFMEHVSVLHDGRRHDMFVDECGSLNGLPRNDEGTKIYRNNYLTMNPGTDPESMPAIYGPAVLFHRAVWF